jgi:PKD repeat protein
MRGLIFQKRFFAFTLLLFSRIVLNAQDFSADNRSGCGPLQVRFYGPEATSWNWSFGKSSSNTSSLRNPVVTYDEPGMYTVTLSIDGGSPIVKTNFITVHQKPDPDFEFNYVQGMASCAPVPVIFTNTSTDPESSQLQFRWIFGDGNTSEIPNPQHDYFLPGNHTVTLFAVNSNGCEQSVTKTNAVTVHDIQAKFTAATFFCSAPAEVQFSNMSLGPGELVYLWDFDDGTTGSELNPTHTFTETGKYNVNLTVKGDFNCENTIERVITVGTAFFEIESDRDRICAGDQISFALRNASDLTSWEWDFGNGQRSTDLFPAITFTVPGKYTVTLHGKLGTCDFVQSKEIEVIALPVPKFDFSQACNRLALFRDASENSSAWLWEFGDGFTSTEKNPTHAYAAAGEFSVKLTVSNSLQCSVVLDEKKINVYDNPMVAIFPSEENNCGVGTSLSGCAPFSIDFSNNDTSGLPIISSVWDFGDGKQSGEIDPPIHEFKQAGTYRVKLSITNSIGCGSIGSVTVKVSKTYPTADFTFDKTEVCVNEIITFKSTSANATFNCWQFNPAESPVYGENVQYSYTVPGVYSVKLTAKNGGCTNDKELHNLITVKGPYVDFQVLENCDEPFKVQLSNYSYPQGDHPTIFDWDFGDGKTAQGIAVPSYTYTETGSYLISLTASDDEAGCMVTTIKPVLIQDVRADFDVSNFSACRDSPIIFTDKSAFAVKWYWDFGDGTFADTPDAENVYETTGRYLPSLTIVDSEGCSDTKFADDIIQVADIKGSFDFDAVSNCDELIVSFRDNTIASPPVNSWKWNFGNGAVSTEANPVAIYDALGTYNVNLTVSNEEGECTISLKDGLLFSNPSVDFMVNRPFACIDENLQFIQTTSYANFIHWDFGDGDQSDKFFPEKKYSSAGPYTVTVSVSDFYGCEKSVTRENFITITKPSASFDAPEILTNCPPLQASFIDKSVDAEKWLWDFGDGQTADAQNPVNSYLFPGIYSVSLRVTDRNGCSDELTREDLVSVGGPVGRFSWLNAANCTEQPVEYSVEYENTVGALWDFGDGNVEQNVGTSILHRYSNGGKIRASVLLSDERGCKVLYNLPEFEVYATPALDLIYAPRYPFVNEEVVFAASSPGTDLSWTFADNVIIGQEKVTKVFSKPGSQPVTVQATDRATGCVKTVHEEIPVQDNIDLIPNVFTPNRDGKNDVFEIPGVENSFWDLLILNRWGRPVYKSTRYRSEWDGGGLTGIFFYKLQNTFRPEIVYKGFVNIIR